MEKVPKVSLVIVNLIKPGALGILLANPALQLPNQVKSGVFGGAEGNAFSCAIIEKPNKKKQTLGDICFSYQNPASNLTHFQSLVT